MLESFIVSKFLKPQTSNPNLFNFHLQHVDLPKTKSMSDAIQQGDVFLSVENEIATIEFFHPLSNSLPGKVLAKLASTVTEAGQR